MIVIDGSMGEGGGQILRTSVALSALTLMPVKVINIRAKRSNPGLRAQHMTAIKAVAALCDAEVEGLSIGSKTIVFKPKQYKPGKYFFDVGTAGSISLVLQALLPIAAVMPEPCEITIRGGTDVKWSPPIDYIINVLLPILAVMGYKVEIEVLRRGHYPKGGGVVRVRTHPVRRFSPIVRTKCGNLIEIQGKSHCVRLPKHVAERQASSAEKTLRSLGITKPINIDLEYYEPGKDPHLGPGSGIVLWALFDSGTIIGADALGERGKPAEVVGREAAEKLVEEMRPKMAFDSHMGDMLIPYLAMADGTSIIGVSKLTLHALTNIMVTEMIMGVKFSVEGKEGTPGIIRVRGLGASAEGF